MIQILAGLAAVVVLFFLVVIIWDVNRFVTIEYRIPCKGLKKSYCFVMLSDLHNKQFGEHNSRLLAAVGGCRPDSVLVAGDMLTSQTSGSFVPALETVKALAGKYPVYYANGNHEYRLKMDTYKYKNRYQDYAEQLRRAGVVLLENQSVSLPGAGIRVYGVEINMDYYQKLHRRDMKVSYLDSLLGRPSPGEYNILIAHNPDYFQAYAGWGADLVLSGHVHGGIMRLPVLGGVLSPALRLFPKYDGGLYVEAKRSTEAKHSTDAERSTQTGHAGNAMEENSRMILGRGLGTHTLPIRVFNPGELIVVRLDPERGS